MLFKACSLLFNALPAGANITDNCKKESVIKIRYVFKKQINVKVMNPGKVEQIVPVQPGDACGLRATCFEGLA
jgi:hypothetical protein